jgi:GrpB-like predicted nucleotidyltransferase (UPF0157 family)
VLQLDHLGSTSVPGLAAKPVIDIDLTVADPAREQDYVSALEAIGYRRTGRTAAQQDQRDVQPGNTRPAAMTASAVASSADHASG